jgi:Notch-like protein
LPSNKCIKNKNGGCNKLSNCASITIDTLCTKDASSNDCYWTSDSKCVDLICDNLPTSFATYKECNDKLNTCTNKLGGGCEI